jgi:hypothetical protein
MSLPYHATIAGLLVGERQGRMRAETDARRLARASEEANRRHRGARPPRTLRDRALRAVHGLAHPADLHGQRVARAGEGPAQRPARRIDNAQYR